MKWTKVVTEMIRNFESPIELNIYLVFIYASRYVVFQKNQRFLRSFMPSGDLIDFQKKSFTMLFSIQKYSQYDIRFIYSLKSKFDFSFEFIEHHSSAKKD